MAKALVRLFKQKTGERDRDLIRKLTITDKNCKPTVGWVRSLVRRYFVDFVIGDDLILLSRSPHGYSVIRSCDPKVETEYAWMYLEIRAIKEEKPQPQNQQIAVLPQQPVVPLPQQQQAVRGANMI